MSGFKTNITLFVLLLMATGMFGQKNASENTLQLRSGNRVLSANATSFFEKENQDRQTPKSETLLRYIQFFQIPSIDKQKELANHGIHLLQYLSNRTYIASISTKVLLSGDLQKDIRSVETINATDKIAPSLLTDFPLDKSEIISVTLQYFNTYSYEEVLTFLRKQHITITEQLRDINAFSVNISSDKLTEIATWPMISNIEMTTTDIQTEDELGHSHHSSNLLNSLWNPAMHFNGEGVHIAIGDDGFIGPHIDLQNRTQQEDLIGDKVGIHGEMVAGILAGAGNINPINKGIADGATLHVLKNFEAVKEAVNLHLEQDVVITNTALSDGCNRGYTTLSQLVDQQTHHYPSLIHVFSAGNAGTDDCEYGAGNGWGNITGGVKAGKNVLAVANLNKIGERVTSSSRGPANDGRIKPDIAAFGDGQIGLAPNNNYQTGSGTSAAAPVISGILAQLYQAYREKNNNVNPPSALLKACLLNSADDLGNEGPDYSFGWGKANAFKAFEILDKNQWVEGTAFQNSTDHFSIDVPAGLKQIRVMVYWHDKEASPTNLKSLVNDIDLSVEAPNGSISDPWILDATPDPNLLDLPATKGIDHLNNVEQVSIKNPSAGTYTFHVNGTEIPFGTQNYFVVYQFDTDELSLTYPTGGESFTPGENILIHWNALSNNSPFALEYSATNGNSWQTIGTAQGNLRQKSWTVPNIQSGEVIVRISRATQTSESSANFSIYNTPDGLNIDQACPTYIRLNWDSIPDAANYIVYQLGKTHMDSIALVTDSSIDISIPNPINTYWFAVSAISTNGAKSRRSIAIPSEQGLKNCTPDNDLALTKLTNPTNNNLSNCFNQSIPVSVNIKNTGANSQSNFLIYYQYNNEPIVEATLNGSLPSGVSLNYTFDQPIFSNDIGNQRLKVWTGLSTDEAFYNDTLRFEFSVISGTINTLPFFENFDLFESCPSDAHCATSCLLQNDWYNSKNTSQDEIDWRVHQGQTPSYETGPDTDQNTGTIGGKYLYLEAAAGCFNQTALLSSPCIDLGSATAPVMSFWYHMYGNDIGNLHIDLFDGTIWHNNIGTAIIGNKGKKWAKATIDLAAFSNQLVVLRFRGETGDGVLTDIAIDNIAVFDAATPPTADFIVNNIRSCSNESIYFYDNSFNETTTWEWTFTPSTVSFLENTNANSKNPVVLFEETGLYSVELNAGNVFGNSTHEKADHILISNGTSLPYVQTFEGISFPPQNWTLQNTDNDISWSSVGVTGKDGQHNEAAYMNNFSYNKANEKDALQSPIIEIGNVNKPLLRFDYAYVSYSNSFADQLTVTLSADCGNSFDQLLFEKSGNQLSTANNQSKAWTPKSSIDWNTVILDLSPYIGQSVSILFTNTCQFGNNLYLDNIAVYEAGDFPETDFEISEQNNTVCIGESLDFTNLSSGNDIGDYDWFFGKPNNNPPFAETEGPHQVTFQETGLQAITLVASNNLGSDVNTQFIQVIDEPAVDFKTQTLDAGLQFWNNTLYGENYIWDFGDGQSSTAKNPVHTYEVIGFYEVSLTVSNACGTKSQTQTIQINNGYNPALPFQLDILPNPANSWFFIETHNNENASLQYKLFSTSGVLYGAETISLSSGIQSHRVDIQQLPAGLYLIQCQVEGRFFTAKLAVY